jgi:hypothetical protein
MVDRDASHRFAPLKVIVLLVTIVAAAAVVRWYDRELRAPFNGDEAAYTAALSYGFKANYLGTAERTGFSFIARALDDYRRTGDSTLFLEDARARDASALRHYHPPVGLYPASVLAGRGVRAEIALRMVPLVLGLATCIATYWLAWVLTKGAPSGARVAGAAVAAALVATSPYHVEVSTELAVHSAFCLFSTLTLGCLVRTWQDGLRRWWVLASSALACAALTVPYSVLLLPSHIATALAVFRVGPGAWSWRSVGRAMAIAAVVGAATLVVVWPPAILSAGLAKPAMLYAWYVLHPLPSSGSESWLMELAVSHRLIVTLFVAAVVLLLLRPDGVNWRSAAPVLLYVGGFLVLNFRVAHIKPLYVGDVIPALAAVSGVGLAMLVDVFRRTIVLAVVYVGVLALLVHEIDARRRTPPVQWREAMARLQSNLAGSHVFVSPTTAAAVLRHYIPTADIVVDDQDPRLVKAIEADIAAGKFTHIALLVRGAQIEHAYSVSDRYREVGTFEIDWMEYRLWSRSPEANEGVVPATTH